MVISVINIPSHKRAGSLGRGQCDRLIFYTLKLTLHSAVDHQLFAKKESLRSEYHNWLLHVRTLAARD